MPMEIATHESVLPSTTSFASTVKETSTVNPRDTTGLFSIVVDTHGMPAVNNNCTDESVMESFEFITFAKKHLMLLIILFGVLMLIVMKCIGWCVSKSSAKNTNMATPPKVDSMPFTYFKVNLLCLCTFLHSLLK